MQPVLPPELTRVVGVPGDDVTTWGITKKVGAKWDRAHFPDASGAHVAHWSLDELTFENITERWGGGEYRTCWFVEDPTNVDPKKRFCTAGGGKAFVLTEPRATRVHEQPAQSAAPIPSLMPPGFEQAMMFMGAIEQRSGAQIERTMNLALSLAGRNSGPDMAMLQTLLSSQQAQFQLMLERQQASNDANVAMLRNELVTLRGELDGGGDEEEESTAATVARAAAPLFKKGQPIGETIMTSVLNWAAEHPDAVVAAVSKVPTVMAALASKKVEQPQAPRARAMPAAPIGVRDGVREVPQQPPPPPPVSWTSMGDTPPTPPAPVVVEAPAPSTEESSAAAQ